MLGSKVMAMEALTIDLVFANCPRRNTFSGTGKVRCQVIPSSVPTSRHLHAMIYLLIDLTGAGELLPGMGGR